MNPYENLSKEAIWTPKFLLTKKHSIATVGSCFAKHISKALITRGYTCLDADLPVNELSSDSLRFFNDGNRSSREVNIFTAALLKQWLTWALTNEPVPDEAWVRSGRFHDPFGSTSVESTGFFSYEEMKASRDCTLKVIRDVFTQADLFIFTLGSAEAWINTENACVYPGTVCGEFDVKKYKLKSYDYNEVRRDLRESFELVKKINPGMKILLTVSAAPLTFVATHKHILVATAHAKSTLRAVAGDMATARADIDYFPSYELITVFPSRGVFDQENPGPVTPESFDFVINTFFSCVDASNFKPNKPIDVATITENEINVQLSTLLGIKDSIDAVEHFMSVCNIQDGLSEQIPRVIFQYWDHDPPSQIAVLLDRNRFLCEQNNIGYVLYSEHEARNFIKENFSETVCRAYDMSPHPAMKCDLFRLCYLHQYGGFYLDADMVLGEQFCQLFSLTGELAVFKWNSDDRNNICNWLIGSAPNSQVIKFAIATTTASILKACRKDPGDALKNILSVSGPGLFTRAIGSFVAQNKQDLPFTIESVGYAYSSVQNGPEFLKKALEYKTTDLHWLVAAQNSHKNTKS